MKNKFLLELKRYLAPLNEEERNEILRFYEERFHTGVVYEGKTEQDIIDELESPRQIAMNVLDEYGYSQTNIPKEQRKPNTVSQKEKQPVQEEQAPFNAWNIVLVILFDIFIVSAVVPMIFGLFMGLGAGWFGFVYETVSLISNSAQWYTILLSVGVLILWLYIVIWLYDLLITFIIWVVRLHLNAFSYKKPSPALKRLKLLKVSTYLQRHGGKGRLKNLLGTFALFAIIIGGAFSVLRFGTIYSNHLNDMNEYTETYDVTTPVSESHPLTIDLSLGYSDIEIRRTNTDKINIIVKELEETPMTIDYSTVGTTLTISNAFDSDVFSWKFVQGILTSIFRNQPSVIIEIPYELDIESITINGSNGDISIRDIVTVNDIMIDTLNGRITFANVSANSIEARTSNGKVSLSDVTTNDMILADTSNGAINGDFLQANSYEFESSNGKIILSNIDVNDKDGNILSAMTSNGDVDLTNVYVSRAILSTSNGDIIFMNDDLTHIFDFVDARTSNGEVDMNVPRN